MHFKLQPSGVMPLSHGGRKPIMRVIGGDDWTFTATLHVPGNPGTPATPENTKATIIIAETQFDNPLWVGEWYKGITPDDVRKGLCHIDVPNSITKSLRRGSYMFSIRVSDLLKSKFVTEIEGSILVEYKPTSDQHSIPYKDGTSGSEEPPKPPISEKELKDGLHEVYIGKTAPDIGKLWIDTSEDD